MTMSVPAMAIFHCGTLSLPGTTSSRPTTATRFSGSVVTSSGQRYSFQAQTNMMVNSAAILVRDRGRIMSKKKRIGPAPSILAASTNSSGSVRKNCR